MYTSSFSGDFLLKENSLLERAADGGACRDRTAASSWNVFAAGHCGKTDPASPFSQQEGASGRMILFRFWIYRQRDPRLKPRNECIHEGYASIALTPIGTRIGLLV